MPVVLRKLQQFVAGDDVTLLIGDSRRASATPTGRNAMRPPLRTRRSPRTCRPTRQAGKVLDMERVTLRYNSNGWAGWGSPT